MYVIFETPCPVFGYELPGSASEEVMDIEGRSQQFGRLSTRASLAALLVLVLTSIHHVYGAVVYATPWRIQVVYFAAATAVLFGACLYLGAFRLRGFASRLAIWLGVVIILLFPVTAIGLFEGGYNHLVKNIVFFALGRAAEMKMFPPPAYEAPGDVFFEVTGIAQFPLGILAAMYAVGLLRARVRG